MHKAAHSFVWAHLLDMKSMCCQDHVADCSLVVKAPDELAVSNSCWLRAACPTPQRKALALSAQHETLHAGADDQLAPQEVVRLALICGMLPAGTQQRSAARPQLRSMAWRFWSRASRTASQT